MGMRIIKLLIKIVILVWVYNFWVLALLVVSNTNHEGISYAMHVTNDAFLWESLQPSWKWMKQSCFPDSPERKPSGTALCEQAD